MDKEKTFHDVKTIKCTQTVSGEDTDQWCDIEYKIQTLEGKKKKSERIENIDAFTGFINTIELGALYVTKNNSMAAYYNLAPHTTCYLTYKKTLRCHKEL